jgi:hypothetical protein
MKKVNNIFNLHDIDIVMHKLYENEEKELRNNILTKKQTSNYKLVEISVQCVPTPYFILIGFRAPTWYELVTGSKTTSPMILTFST